MTLLCYGRGDAPQEIPCDVIRIPRALSPRRLEAGPSAGKPVADLALAAALVRAQRARGFDAAIAHNAEAALAAVLARPVTGLPVVYVAHTLFGLELASFGPLRLQSALRRFGRLVDRVAARRSDGVIVLCDAARRRLAPLAKGPVSLIPPGLDPGPEPDPAEVAATCAAHGVTPGGFAIYAGNLDAYQELDRLERAAREVPELPVLVATHAELPAQCGALCFARVTTPDEVRRLVFGAALALLPRRHGAGFPIKLLNYMEASRAIVATEGVVDGLEHERSAWLLPANAPAGALADAMRRLAGDPTLAARLGAGARAVLALRHAWPDLARRTLRLTSAVAR